LSDRVLLSDVELVLVPFGIAAILAAAVGQHAQQLNLMAVEEWQYAVVQKIRRRDQAEYVAMGSMIPFSCEEQVRLYRGIGWLRGLITG
jgi:hypothetical protein